MRVHAIAAVAVVAGLLAMALMMGNEAQVPHGPLWGMAALGVCLAGSLYLLRDRAPADLVSWRETGWAARDSELGWMAPLYWAPLALVVLFVGSIVGGYDALPIVILVSVVLLVPPAIRRPGLLLFVIVTAIYLPLLGTYSLSDPWETHYGEVAREILARDDWISLWWAQENWFWSKPILIFWMEALTMGALGVEFLPDAHPASPEWAIRLPIFLISLATIMVVYFAVAARTTRRAGLLSAVALATMPHFFLIGHQAITDMPFVGNMTMAMMMFFLAVTEPASKQARSYQFGSVQLSARDAVLALLLILCVPQILYLASRNFTLVDGFLFAWHTDEFHFGSAGNTGVPGNLPSYQAQPFVQSFMLEPMAQALYWSLGLAVLVWVVFREKRTQSLYMLAFYIFCGLAFMGKGVAGFGLPGLVVLFYLLCSNRWKLLSEGRFRVAVGVLTVAVVGAPWYVAMFVRHGFAFTDRLLVHDHLNRLAAGVHGDTGTIAYFLEQFGFATFPWVGLVPAAAMGWLWVHRNAEREEPTAQSTSGHTITLLILLAVWFTCTFTLFSAMITKFHHYIFPAVPPAALGVGLVLDRLWGSSGRSHRTRASDLAAFAAPVPLVLGVAGLWGNVRGVVPAGVDLEQADNWVLSHGWPALHARALLALGLMLAFAAVVARRPRLSFRREGAWLAAALVVSVGATLIGGVAAWAAAVLVIVLGATWYSAPEDSTSLTPHWGIWAAVLGAATVAVAMVGRDLAWVTTQRPAGYEKLLHLFVYNYQRPWPAQFDYRPILTGFGVAAALCCAIGVFKAFQPVAARALTVTALMFCTWGVNIYLIDLAPHWGQKELIDRYYEERKGPAEPLVAWQMNWKGENFYTGNRVSVFVNLDNSKLREWVGDQKGQTAYFILEHSRFTGLQSLLPHPAEKITSVRQNNKFVLVRAQL